jgi:glutathione-regulated potassium-efflux system protein KefB
VRAYDRIHLMELAPLDLKCTIREVFESAVAMGREALALFCIDAEEVDRVECVYRERDRLRLDSQTASGDLHAMSETVFGPDNPLGERKA